METCLCLQRRCPDPSVTLAEGLLLLTDPLTRHRSLQGLPTLVQVMCCRDAGDGYLGSHMCPTDGSELMVLVCPPGRGPGNHCGFGAGRREPRRLGREQRAALP